MLNFKEKVAIVTGAGSGIGKNIAIALAKNGAKVVIVNRSEQNGLNTLSEIEALGGTAIFVQADISKVDDVKTYINKTVETFGRIDCLVNNAGIIGDREAVINYDEDVFSSVLDTNVKGTFYGLKYGIQEMLKTGGGSIVNVSSVLGLSGCPSMSAYSASKHAIIGLTKSAVAEFGGMNIRINALCPGFVATELGQDSMPEQMKAYLLNRVPMKRLGFVEDVTNNALFLLSDEAKYVNGTTHVVDGGLSSSYL